MDIFLAALLFLVASATAYLGVHVTLHPPATDKAKRSYKVAFLALTVVALGLIIWQTILNRRETGSLHAQLNKIQKNTETPPSVTVNVPPSAPPQIIVNNAPPSKHVALGFVKLSRNPQFLNGGQIIEGLPLRVNIFFANKGSEPVENVATYYGTAIAPIAGDPDKLDREIHAKFYSDARKGAATSPLFTLNPGDEMWNTVDTPKLTKEQVEGLIGGTVRFYAYGWARWKNESHDFDLCLWLQAPRMNHIDNDMAVWHMCAP